MRSLLALLLPACAPGSYPVTDSPVLDPGHPDPPPDAPPPSGDGCDAAPSLEDLREQAPVGAADLAFGPDCRAWISTIVSGGDQVVVIDGDGVAAAIPGHADWNMPALVLSPDGRSLALAHNDNTDAGIARLGPGDAALVLLAEGTLVEDDAWDNGLLQRSAASIAWGPDGCIWVPNLHAAGTLSCVRPDGAVEELRADLEPVRAVAVAPGGELVVAAGRQLLALSPRTGADRLLAELGADILDLIVASDGGVVLESAAGEVLWLPPGGDAPRLLATVEGQAHLAWHPDGSVLRMVPAPVGPASFERLPPPR